MILTMKPSVNMFVKRSPTRITTLGLLNNSRLGHTFVRVLGRRFKRSDACVFIATGNSVRSRWCHAETEAFWGAGKPVLVYVADSKGNDIAKIVALQGDFVPHPSAEAKNRIAKEAGLTRE